MKLMQYHKANTVPQSQEDNALPQAKKMSTCDQFK
jgi:hypothetical protein